MEPVTTRRRGCYVCESIQEPSGQLLAKIWALKARLNQSITGQVQVSNNRNGPVILKYAGTMAPLAPILLVVGGAKAELAQALVPCETGAM